MNKLKIESTTFKYGLILILTGFIIFIYSKTIFLLVDNIDIGERFNSPSFFQSDLFSSIGIFQVLIGLIYLLIHFKAKFYLIDKATVRNYWLTMPFVLIILATPILDKYYPTDKYRDSILTNIITFYAIISSFIFFGGIYYFIMNFIKSIYVFYLIKRNWE